MAQTMLLNASVSGGHVLGTTTKESLLQSLKPRPVSHLFLVGVSKSSSCASFSPLRTVALFKSKTKAPPKKVEPKSKPKVEDGIFGTSGGIGFTKQNELFVGRVAMIGFAASLLGEALTGKGILQQLNLETGIPIYEAEPLLLFFILFNLLGAIGALGDRGRFVDEQPTGLDKAVIPPGKGLRSALGLSEGDVSCDPPPILLPVTTTTTDVYSNAKFLATPFRYGSAFHFHEKAMSNSMPPEYIHHKSKSFSTFTDSRYSGRDKNSQITRAGWFLGLGEKKKQVLPEIVKAGDPVLHESAAEVPPEEISSERIQKIIDDMINVMRKPPGVGLAAPQIGIPLKIIVLEDTEEYISYVSKKEAKAQDRNPFDLLVIINPNLKPKGNKTALFFEGCLSIDGFRAVVERHLEVEITGFDRNGQAIRLVASGWQARILQHECDHLNGYLYVDKMVPKTFRTAENLELPLATGCPKLGVKS